MRNNRLRKLRWYLNRLISMGPGEIIYRVGGQLTISQERSVVRKLDHDYTPYPIPEGFFQSFKAAGWPDFFYNDREAAHRDQMIGGFHDGVKATIEAAELLLEQKILMFGRTLLLDNPVQWAKDPLTGKSWPVEFWASIDIRDGQRVGGIKWSRELNRHHQFVTLGKAYWLTGDERFATALTGHFESWIDQNPPFIGIGWSSALSNAIRVINWIWALNFIYRSPALTEALFGRIISALLAQTEFIGRHLSKYSSANNHLIGEAAGLAFFGLCLPWVEGAKSWRERGLKILTAEISKQIYPDGVPAEQAFNYLGFDLDFFVLVWSAMIQKDIAVPAIWRERIGAACGFLGAVMDEQGRVPAVGDSDDGRVLAIDEQQGGNNFRSILASSAVLLERPAFKSFAGGWDEKSHWLLGEAGRERFEDLTNDKLPRLSKLFEVGGYGLMRQATTSLLYDFGPLGYLSLAAHGHADALSLLLTVKGQPIFIDPGTYAYREGGAWRGYFRGTSAHNTIMVDGQEQSEMRGDFLWGKRAMAQLLDWQSNGEFDLCTAEHDGYSALGVIHRRTVLFYKPDLVLVVDTLSGEGVHQVEQNWHFPIGAVVEERDDIFTISIDDTAVQMLTDSVGALSTKIVSGEVDPIQGWVSTHYGHKEAAPVLVVSGQCPLPLRVTALINLGEGADRSLLVSQRDQLRQLIDSA